MSSWVQAAFCLPFVSVVISAEVECSEDCVGRVRGGMSVKEDVRRERKFSTRPVTEESPNVTDSHTKMHLLTGYSPHTPEIELFRGAQKCF